MRAERNLLDGGRWHFRHGPIDIVIGADGDAAALTAAHDTAWQRFETVLAELVAELPLLRMPVDGDCALRGRVARRMWHACAPYAAGFITPMAAVAGSVAEELIRCYRREGVRRAWVNNGGDIALHLAAGERLRIGLYADLSRFDPFEPSGPPLRTDAAFSVDASQAVRGIATSGWRGRSHSFGIADSVTILAATASAADAAATVVANAVNVDDPRIGRRPACELKDDSDLGMRRVTVDVPPLGCRLVHDALGAGRRRARELRDDGLIVAAGLVCQGWFTSLDAGPPRLLAATDSIATGSVLA